MKRNHLIHFFILFLLTIFLGGCSSKAASTLKSAEKKPVTVNFWHAMSGVKEQALTKITKDFMKQNPKIKIHLENQSSYTELQQKLQVTLSTPEELPTLTQGYPGWLYDAFENDLLTDLDPLLKSSNKQEPIANSFLKAAQIDGKQVGLPFSKSTEILFYNEELLKEHQLNVPTNLEELTQVAKILTEKTHGEVYGAGFEVLANYLSVGLKDRGMEFNSAFDLTNPTAEKLILNYRQGLKEKYFVAPSPDTPLMNLFCAGKLGFFIASSSREGDIKKGINDNFSYGVAKRPSKTNNLQGTDLYLFKTTTEKVKKAAFSYMTYLTNPKVQLFWASQTGYLPVTASSLTSSEYLKNNPLKTPLILKDALSAVVSQPNLKNADPAFNEVRTAIEATLAVPEQEKVKEILEQQQAALEAAWEA